MVFKRGIQIPASSGNAEEELMRELTVCSVSFQSAFFLKWNWELCRKLNPGAGYSWIVADNTPASVREAWDVDDPDFTVVPGVDGSRFTGACAPGLHHGEALNRSLRLVKTRFASLAPRGSVSQYALS